MSGVATATHEFVRRTAGSGLRICCTRKTTPGLRALESPDHLLGFGRRKRLSELVLERLEVKLVPVWLLHRSHYRHKVCGHKGWKGPR